MGQQLKPHIITALMLIIALQTLHGSLAQNCGCASGYCCSQWGWCGVTSDYCGTGCQSGPCWSSSSGLGNILTESLYNQFFPYKNSFYSYSAFISAASAFPTFGTTGDSSTQKREIAAFLAHVFVETGGLTAIDEYDQSSNYCDSSNTQYPCAPGQSYWGRGPLQLSWNYNYGAAGNDLGLDLLHNPNILSTNAISSFQSALWFWLRDSSYEPSCHNVMVGNWSPSSQDQAAGRFPGFGLTIDIINGGIECGANPANTNGANNRVSYYESFCGQFGVDPGSNLYCSSMQHY